MGYRLWVMGFAGRFYFYTEKVCRSFACAASMRNISAATNKSRGDFLAAAKAEAPDQTLSWRSLTISSLNSPRGFGGGEDELSPWATGLPGCRMLISYLTLCHSSREIFPCLKIRTKRSTPIIS